MLKSKPKPKPKPIKPSRTAQNNRYKKIGKATKTITKKHRHTDAAASLLTSLIR